MFLYKKTDLILTSNSNTMKKFIKISSVIVALSPFYFNAQNQPITPSLYSDDLLIKTPIPTPQTPEEELNSKIVSMFNDPVMRNAQWGFVVYDPKKKKILNSYNENASLIPASV